MVQELVKSNKKKHYDSYGVPINKHKRFTTKEEIIQNILGDLSTTQENEEQVVEDPVVLVEEDPVASKINELLELLEEKRQEGRQNEFREHG